MSGAACWGFRRRRACGSGGGANVCAPGGPRRRSGLSGGKWAGGAQKLAALFPVPAHALAWALTSARRPPPPPGPPAASRWSCGTSCLRGRRRCPRCRARSRLWWTTTLASTPTNLWATACPASAPCSSWSGEGRAAMLCAAWPCVEGMRARGHEGHGSGMLRAGSSSRWLATGGRCRAAATTSGLFCMFNAPALPPCAGGKPDGLPLTTTGEISRWRCSSPCLSELPGRGRWKRRAPQGTAPHAASLAPHIV